MFWFWGTGWVTVSGVCSGWIFSDVCSGWFSGVGVYGEELSTGVCCSLFADNFGSEEGDGCCWEMTSSGLTSG